MFSDQIFQCVSLVLRTSWGLPGHGDSWCREWQKMRSFECLIKTRKEWFGNNRTRWSERKRSQKEKKTPHFTRYAPESQQNLFGWRRVKFSKDDKSWEFIVLVLHSGDAGKIGDTNSPFLFCSWNQLSCDLRLLRTGRTDRKHHQAKRIIHPNYYLIDAKTLIKISKIINYKKPCR